MDTFGKGLGSLIPGGGLPKSAPSISAPSILPLHEVGEEDTFLVLEVSPERIDPNPRQPRSHFNEEKLEELKKSIAEYGILEPLIVTEKGDGRFELIAGERRLRAAKLLKLSKVPIVVRHADDLEKLELSLIENIQRQDLNPIEEAEGYRELIETFGLTQEEAAKRSGKSRESISNYLRMLELPTDMQRAVAKGDLTPAHARILLSIDHPKVREEIFEKMTHEGLTVREAQELAAPKIRRKRAGAKDPATLADEERLREKLNTKVQIEKRGQRGRIIVQFYSEEDYQDVIGKIVED